MSGKPSVQHFSSDEFKLYYESTEKVTDRRHETNRWNYSICIAMLVAVAVITKWSLTSASLLWIGFAAVAALSAMAVLFCALWVGQIRDFRKLNTTPESQTSSPSSLPTSSISFRRHLLFFSAAF